MNSTINISDLKNRYYVFYLENDKPKLLKKNSETQLQGSLSKLKDKGIDAYFCIDLETFEINYLNYKESTEIEEPYMNIVKTKNKIYFHNVGGRAYYDEPVLLSMGNFVSINRRNKTFIKYIK